MTTAILGIIIATTSAILSFIKDIRLDSDQKAHSHLKKNWIPASLILLALIGMVIAVTGVVQQERSKVEQERTFTNMNLARKATSPEFNIHFVTPGKIHDQATNNSEMFKALEKRTEHGIGFIPQSVKESLFSVDSKGLTPSGILTLNLGYYSDQIWFNEEGFAETLPGVEDHFVSFRAKNNAKNKNTNQQVFALKIKLDRERQADDVYRNMMQLYYKKEAIMTVKTQGCQRHKRPQVKEVNLRIVLKGTGNPPWMLKAPLSIRGVKHNSKTKACEYRIFLASRPKLFEGFVF